MEVPCLEMYAPARLADGAEERASRRRGTRARLGESCRAAGVEGGHAVAIRPGEGWNYAYDHADGRQRDMSSSLISGGFQ